MKVWGLNCYFGQYIKKRSFENLLKRLDRLGLLTHEYKNCYTKIVAKNVTTSFICKFESISFMDDVILILTSP